MSLKSIILFMLLSMRLVEVFSQCNDIIWQEDQLLTWVDFHGISPPKELTEYGAVSALGITLKNYSSDSLQVLAIFYCEESWKSNDLNSKSSFYLLEHEQIHFDIAEFFARKLRLRLIKNECLISTSEIYNGVISEWDDYDRMFDRKTLFGKEINRQSEFRTSLKDSLFRYCNYSVNLTVPECN